MSDTGVSMVPIEIQWFRMRSQIYADNKAAGRPDPLDVFDDYKGPVYTPPKKEEPHER